MDTRTDRNIPHHSPDGLVRDLTATHDKERACAKTLVHHLAIEGGDYVLWSVVEITIKKDGVVSFLGAGQSVVLLQCNLLKQVHGGWKHEHLRVADNLHYYSCPQSYLDMTPEHENEKPWRERMRLRQVMRKRLGGLVALGRELASRFGDQYKPVADQDGLYRFPNVHKFGDYDASSGGYVAAKPAKSVEEA